MLLVNWGYIRGQAMTMAFNPAQLPDTKLRRLYEYWCSRCQGGALPSRRDIDPLDIPDLLPNLFLLDVIGDAEDFVFRLAGSRVEEAFSMRSEEHTSELQSLMRISYDVFCFKK